MSKTEMPSIRFGGFDNAWEQRKLGEIITEYKETVDSECTLPILTSSKTEGVILQEEHFGRKQQHDITGYNILPRNYCTYRNRSDGVDFTFNINKCCDKGIISKFYPVFSGKNSDVFFLSLVLNNSDEVVREIAYTCTGTGQKVLSFLDLQKMKVRVPSYDEQKEIAAYFENLDHLITLHQRKYEKLQAFKVSMLEKMFPKDGADVPYEIDAYLTEINTGVIDADYMNSRFKKYIKALQDGSETAAVLDELHKSFATLTQEEQKYANIFLHDVQNGDVIVDEGKTLRDYITEYMTRAKNDQIHRFAVALSVDETMLRSFMKLKVTEANINEFGRFDKLKSTINRNTAKSFLEALEGTTIKPFQINMKVDQVLRKFILEGGYDL